SGGEVGGWTGHALTPTTSGSWSSKALICIKTRAKTCETGRFSPGGTSTGAAVIRPKARCFMRKGQRSLISYPLRRAVLGICGLGGMPDPYRKALVPRLFLAHESHCAGGRSVTELGPEVGPGAELGFTGSLL